MKDLYYDGWNRSFNSIKVKVEGFLFKQEISSRIIMTLDERMLLVSKYTIIDCLPFLFLF